MFIKELFRSNGRQERARLNYLQIYIFDKILKSELLELKHKNIDTFECEDEDNIPYLLGKDCQMISMYIFRRIFKSD